jgi:hypothetical protein
MSFAQAIRDVSCEPEPADHAAADPLGERGQVSLGDRPRRQERRRGVTRCFGGSRHEDAVSHACVEMHVVVERRAESVNRGSTSGCVGVSLY